MNEGQPRFYNSSGKAIKTDIYVETEYKINMVHKLLWLFLWPVYIFEWVAGIGDRTRLQEAVWCSNLWFYKVIMWHDSFLQWGDIVTRERDK